MSLNGLDGLTEFDNLGDGRPRRKFNSMFRRASRHLILGFLVIVVLPLAIGFVVDNQMSTSESNPDGVATGGAPTEPPEETGPPAPENTESATPEEAEPPVLPPLPAPDPMGPIETDSPVTLETISAADSAAVEKHVGKWVAGIGSFPIDSNQSEKEEFLEGEVLKHKEEYGALLFKSADYQSTNDNLWMLISGVSFEDGESAFGWCDERQFYGNECWVKYLTNDHSVERTYYGSPAELESTESGQ